MQHLSRRTPEPKPENLQKPVVLASIRMEKGKKKTRKFSLVVQQTFISYLVSLSNLLYLLSHSSPLTFLKNCTPSAPPSLLIGPSALWRTWRCTVRPTLITFILSPEKHPVHFTTEAHRVVAIITAWLGRQFTKRKREEAVNSLRCLCGETVSRRGGGGGVEREDERWWSHWDNA